jgi:hypothetical protein
MDQHSAFTYWLGNGTAAAAIVGTLLGWAPAIAAVIAGGWYLLQMYESKTVQAWVRDRRVRKLARLKAEAIMLEAKLKQPETSLPLSHTN